MKKASILGSECRPTKKYQADFKEFIEYAEEEHLEDDNDPEEEKKDPNGMD